MTSNITMMRVAKKSRTSIYIAMKKIIVIVVAIAMLVVFSSCNKEDNASQTNQTGSDTTGSMQIGSSVEAPSANSDLEPTFEEKMSEQKGEPVDDSEINGQSSSDAILD